MRTGLSDGIRIEVVEGLAKDDRIKAGAVDETAGKKS